MYIYNKLARDKVPTLIKASGKQPHTRILSEQEYIQALHEKLQEKVFLFTATDSLEELADILELVHTLAKTHHITPRELETIRACKARSEGGFKERIFLEHVD